MKILLVRHGETDWNRQPARCQGWAEVGLNARGREQARAQGRALRGRGLRLVVTSHLLRARETARLILEESGEELRLVADPRLAETHRGDWEARTFDEIKREEPETFRRYREEPQHFRFPGGESLADQQHRVLAALRDVCLGGEPAVLVTHGGSIRLVRCFLDGRGIASFHDMSTDNCGVDEIDAAGLADRITAFLA